MSLSLALSLLPACGGDDDDGPGGGADVDAGPGAVDGGAATCPAAEALGSFEPLPEAGASHATQDQDPAVRRLAVGGIVDDQRPPARVDYFVVELWDGYGAFADRQLAAGQYTIAGPEATGRLCGVCAYVLADVRPEDGQLRYEMEYVATAGTVTIDSVGTRAGNDITGNYAGRATGLTFVEIDPASNQGAPLAGGCRTSIDSVTWNAPIANGDAL